MLPKIPVKHHKIHLPCSNIELQFRAYTAAEEKIILDITSQKQDKFDIQDFINAFEQIIQNCLVDKKIDVSEIPTSDIEYLFIRIREVSVGDDIKKMFKCPECETIGTTELSLHDIQEPKIPEGHTKVIILDEESEIGLRMKYPNLKTLASISKDESVVNMMKQCIECVFEKDSVTYIQDVSPEELETFVLSMEQKHIKKIESFFETTPTTKLEVEHICKECGHKSSETMAGLIDFFI